ncbi:hypothetical protein MRX96_012233 [Rhipicephalus microplus]
MFRGVRLSSSPSATVHRGHSGAMTSRQRGPGIRTHSEDREGQVEEASFIAEETSIPPKASGGTGIRKAGNQGQPWPQDSVVPPPEAQAGRGRRCGFGRHMVQMGWKVERL